MLLIDTDMLVLLAATDLLDCVVSKLGFEMKDVRRLAAAPHQARRSKSLRDQYGADALEAALPKIEAIAPVDPATDLELLDHLNALMDPGEALLFAVASSQGEALLMIGDKRAIQGLAEGGNADCLESMQGRIVTLEAVLWMLLKDRDAPALHSALRAAASHKTLRIIFSETNVASVDGCALAIGSYFGAAVKVSAGLLHNPDPGLLS